MRRLKVRSGDVHVGSKYEINNRGWRDCVVIDSVLSDGGWLVVNQRTGGVAKIRSAGCFLGPCFGGSLRGLGSCGCRRRR